MLNGIWTVSYSTNQNYHLPKHPLSLLCGKNWKINYISRLTIPPLDHWAPQPRTWSNILLEHVLLLYYALTSYLYPTATAVLVLELCTVMTDVKQCEISPHLSHGEIQLSPHQSCGSDLHVIARRKVEPKIEPVEKRSKNWSSVMR